VPFIIQSMTPFLPYNVSILWSGWLCLIRNHRDSFIISCYWFKLTELASLRCHTDVRPPPLQPLSRCWSEFIIIWLRLNKTLSHPTLRATSPYMQTVFIKCVMCARTFLGGGGIFIDRLRNWYLCKNCPLSQSWIKDRLITLPVFVLQILMFV